MGWSNSPPYLAIRKVLLTFLDNSRKSFETFRPAKSWKPPCKESPLPKVPWDQPILEWMAGGLKDGEKLLESGCAINLFTIKNETSYFRFAHMKVLIPVGKDGLLKWHAKVAKGYRVSSHTEGAERLVGWHHQKFCVRVKVQTCLLPFLISHLEDVPIQLQSFAPRHILVLAEIFHRKTQLKMIDSNIDAWSYTVWIS